MTELMPGFYRPFLKDEFSVDRCFLCGNSAGDDKTAEHIFPKWLLHEFNLWNESSYLLNASSIPYRYLTIPCCKTCNGGVLSQMEMNFKALYKRKFSDLSSDDELVIFQWCTKVFYGLLYKEHLSLHDRSNPLLGTILPAKVIENIDSIHLLLQSIRFALNFGSSPPWSIFIFSYGDDSFDYMDDFESDSLSIKLGRIGVTISINDGGEVRHFMQKLTYLERHPLNEAQYIEISNLIFYARRIAINSIKAVFNYNEKAKTFHYHTINALNFGEWDYDVFYRKLKNMLDFRGIPYDGDTFTQKGYRPTFLVDNDGASLLKKMVPPDID